MLDKEELDNGYDQIVKGAVMLGFKDLGADKYECTREQLIMLCAIVAQQAIKQSMDRG